MTERVTIGDLQIDKVLVDFLTTEALPTAGIDADTYWKGFTEVFHRFAPRNKELLETREKLQRAIDEYHAEHPGPVDGDAYKAFLKDIGYLVEAPGEYEVKTENVDREIAEVAGPQLVVPVLNKRFAINAANARWGSLYDALYATDSIPEDDGAEQGDSYNPKRGEKVIAWGRRFLDTAIPLASGSHADATAYDISSGSLEVTLKDGSTQPLAQAEKFIGWQGEQGSPSAILFQNHGLYFEIQIDPESPIGKGDDADVKDIFLESAVSAIMDFEDSVAAVDGEDKVLGYRNWLELNTGNAAEEIEKNGKTFTRVLNDNRTYTSREGGELTLSGKVFMFVRNVGHLMTTPAVLDADGNELPEGILDALVTSVCAIPGIDPANEKRNSTTGSIYIVKPKQHGPEEVAFTRELFSAVEEVVGLPANTLKVGVMDEERRTTVNLAACIKEVDERVVFINTGFLDRTGDEIHTSMKAGVMIPKGDMKGAHWMTSYEDWNVDTGLAHGLPGKAQIGKGMWAMTDLMADMLEQKVGQPKAGASTAWVPSPLAGTLHATHYHQVDVSERQKDIAAGGPRRTIDDLLQIPLATDHDSWTEEFITKEVENSCQSILGYVARWVEQGVGCSKVPDINDVNLMEDRATLRISSQLLSNWLLHGVLSEESFLEALRRMAKVVDEQNAGDDLYHPMAPNFEESIAWCAARDLVLKGTTSPSGYTEPILHERRHVAKEKFGAMVVRAV